MRIGQGYDIHITQPGDGLVIGGVTVPCEIAFSAHSDGDVLLHAIIDSLLGAMADGDIGEHFPDTDPKYKGVDSTTLLEATMERVRARGLKVSNIDSSVILEKPKLKSYKAAIRQRVAELLGIEISQVGFKAKTKEKQDATGQGKAVEAQCVVLLVNEECS